MTETSAPERTEGHRTTPEQLEADVTGYLVQAGVPARFADRRIGTYESRAGAVAGLRAARAMASGEREGLILSGPPGTGKTHLAVGILADRLETWLTEFPVSWWEDRDEATGDVRIARRPGLEVRFVVVPTFLDRLRSAIRYADRDDPLPEMFEVDLLVLDDLGREKVTDWASERLYVLVNERYNRRLPTIVTTNYAPDQLVDRGYDALVSRLVEGAGVVLLTASDYRSEVGR